MLKNYLKVALNSLKKSKTNTFVNIAGLSIGLVCFALIALFIQDELSYDRYHSKADDIYRITTELKDEKSGELTETTASTFFPVGQEAKKSISGIKNAVRFYGYSLNLPLVQYNDSKFYEEHVFYTDAEVFDVFDYKFINGNPRNALTQPGTIVLTERLAKKYFAGQNPLGKTIRIDNGDFEVTGVIEDLPANSHFDVSALLSFSTIEDREHYLKYGWNLLGFYTYILVEPGSSTDHIQSQINTFVSSRAEALGLSTLLLQPLTDIHLYSNVSSEIEPNSSIKYVYLFGSIALLILVIACINYMNLALAAVSRRVTEVGIRKAMGAEKRNVFNQFLIESLVISFLSLLIIVLLIELSLPVLNAVTGKAIVINYLTDGGVLLCITILAGVLTSVYPAYTFSGYDPVRAIKGSIGIAGSRNQLPGFFRKGLVVFQFTVSIVLIIATISVQNQLDYVQNERLGFDKENLVVIHQPQKLGSQLGSFKERIQALSGVKNVTSSTNVPGQSIFNEYGMSSGEGENVSRFYLTYNEVDPNFINTFGLSVEQGRGFSDDNPNDVEKAILVNEATVKKMGWEEPIGEELFSRTVVGVLSDYLIQSSRDEVKPSSYILGNNSARFITIKLAASETAPMLKQIDQVWEEFVTTAPLNFSFVDTDIEALYRSEQRLGNIFSIFSFLAIFIASMGLFALATFIIESRTKEIGVRKVLGASAISIIMLVNRQFTTLIIIAFTIALPLAWYMISKWMDIFVYKTSVGIGIYLIAGVIVIGIAWTTLSFKSIKAAMLNPIDSLRSE